MTQRVRILRVVSNLRVSGPALQAILLAAQLNDDDYETLLVAGKTPDNDDTLVDTARRYGVEPVFVPDLRRTTNPLTQWRAVRALYRLIREYQPDVIHTHLTMAGLWGRVLGRLLGVPVIVHTFHEHPFRGIYGRLQTFTFVQMERGLARLTDSIITLSEGLRREIVDHYHLTRRSRITVLPLGFDLSAFANMPRRAGLFRQMQHLPPDAPLVGIIGRLVPVKNHALFLEAAALLHRERPDVRFVIIGDGALRPALEAQAAALGLRGCVTFTGWLREMPTVYSDLDVLAISSFNEGTPVPIIEALASGCAVVATQVGGVADLLDNGAFGQLVPSGDAAALAAALRHALDHPPDPAAARHAMLSRYSIERLVADLASLYRGLRLAKASTKAAQG
jgi:glycosyltransferase involved in cell wall biosynthesis